jgi:hypothetical protein
MLIGKLTLKHGGLSKKLLDARRAAKVSHFVAFSLITGCSKMPGASRSETATFNIER